MRIHSPTSSEKIGRFINFNDMLAVFAAGPIAFVLRDPSSMFDGYPIDTLIYCVIGFSAGLLMLIAFHLGKNLSDYISMRDAYAIVQVSLATTALTSSALFSLTRLEHVPRSIPIIHFLVLCSLMFFGRVAATRLREMREMRKTPRVANPRHVIMIGANRLAWFYLRMINTFDLGKTDIVAILDENPKVLGRSMGGRPVLAPPAELPRVVTEYQVHGVKIDRVIISGNRNRHDKEDWTELEDYCRESGMGLDFLGDILGLELESEEAPDEAPQPAARAIGGYFAFKRVFDFTLSFLMLALLLPIIAPVALGVLIDVGWPIVFWQKRDGRHGRPFLVYKFRTLRAPFNRHGQFVPESERISRFGELLRRTRLDELPQLWNVLAGDMSFIGPRPLLPIDQPANSLRLLVSPGLTGWAQINGGKLITPEEKGALDDWYVQNASFWLDVRIVLLTLKIVITGDQRDDAKLAPDAPLSEPENTPPLGEARS